jgi:menaquinone-9 beta-reductase
MIEQVFDVAVIGGGIAGCAAAIRLAQQNYRVVVCEAKSYPHHKVCGEFLSPECSALLGNLGLTSAIQAVKPAAIHTAAIIAPDGTTWAAALPGEAIGISRYALDDLMAAHAHACGVDFRELTTVTQLQGDLRNGFSLILRSTTGQKTIQARTVIGAHGKRSLIDRALDRPFLKQAQPFIGLKAHFYGPPLPGRIHLYAFPGGYCGLSEIENGQTNVCLLVQQETFQAAGAGSITQFIEWMKTQNPALGAWLSKSQPIYENWISIAQVPYSDKEIVANDILMVGDSAGLIAPVAGDGMGMALQASFMAAKWLNAYLSGQISADTLRQQYTAEWWQSFRLRLRLSRLLQTLMLRPRWLTPGLHVLNAAPKLGQFIVTHTRESRLLHT